MPFVRDGRTWRWRFASRNDCRVASSGSGSPPASREIQLCSRRRRTTGSARSSPSSRASRKARSWSACVSTSASSSASEGPPLGALEARDECCHHLFRHDGDRLPFGLGPQPIESEDPDSEEHEPQQRLAHALLRPDGYGVRTRGRLRPGGGCTKAAGPEATTHPFPPRSAQVTLLVATLTGASVAFAHRLDPGLLVVDATGSPVRGTWTPPAAAPQVQPLSRRM